MRLTVSNVSRDADYPAAALGKWSKWPIENTVWCQAESASAAVGRAAPPARKWGRAQTQAYTVAPCATRSISIIYLLLTYYYY